MRGSPDAPLRVICVRVTKRSHSGASGLGRGKPFQRTDVFGRRCKRSLSSIQRILSLIPFSRPKGETGLSEGSGRIPRRWRGMGLTRPVCCQVIPPSDMAGHDQKTRWRGSSAVPTKHCVQPSHSHPNCCLILLVHSPIPSYGSFHHSTGNLHITGKLSYFPCVLQKKRTPR